MTMESGISVKLRIPSLDVKNSLFAEMKSKYHKTASILVCWEVIDFENEVILVYESIILPDQPSDVIIETLHSCIG